LPNMGQDGILRPIGNRPLASGRSADDWQAGCQPAAGCHPAPHSGKPQTAQALAQSCARYRQADCQSAAGCQPAPQNRRGVRRSKWVVVHSGKPQTHSHRPGRLRAGRGRPIKSQRRTERYYEMAGSRQRNSSCRAPACSARSAEQSADCDHDSRDSGNHSNYREHGLARNEVHRAQDQRDLEQALAEIVA